MAGEHTTGEQTSSHKTSSWIAVVVIVVASILLGFAFVMKSIPLAVVGGVLLVAGGAYGVAKGIMEDVH